MSPSSIDQSSTPVLVNAVYFKAVWKDTFVREWTSDSTFTLPGGEQIQLSTIKTQSAISVWIYKGADYQALALSYKGKLAEMLILLPDEGLFESFEKSPDAGKCMELLMDCDLAD